jgi:hypothetical protein
MIIFVEIFMMLVCALNAYTYRGTLTGWLSAIGVTLWIVVFILAKFYDDNSNED